MIWNIISKIGAIIASKMSDTENTENWDFVLAS